MINAHLAALWPDAVVELDHQNAYQLLVATILAAQANDKTINLLTPAVFARYPDAHALARAEPAELEPMIKQSGFFRNKARHVIGMARALVERHDGEVPDTMEALCALPGVARKTANVVLGCALGKNTGVIVDTHVTRLTGRLGLTRETDPVKIELDLMKLVPQADWTRFANRLIWHGRRVCDAKRPDCEHCALAPVCPSAGLGAAITAGKARAATVQRAAATAGKARAATVQRAAATAGKARAATVQRAATGRTAAGPAAGANQAARKTAKPARGKPASARAGRATAPARGGREARS